MSNIYANASRVKKMTKHFGLLSLMLCFYAISTGFFCLPTYYGDTSSNISTIERGHMSSDKQTIPFDNVKEFKTLTTSLEKCFLKTRDIHYYAKSRFIIFQRDAGHNLLNLISYYNQVVPLDSLVVIDHLGQDHFTAQILLEYGSKGIHVWRCEGPFKDKAKMWSAVTKVYGETSDFVFPIDTDEYIAVVPSNRTMLVWNQSAFYSELDLLAQKDDGRTFKTFGANAIPPDCLNTMSRRLDFRPIFYPQTCFIQKVILKLQRECGEKTFQRGKNFVSTDTGNHGGKNTRDIFRCMRHVRNKKNPNPYVYANIAIIHMSDLSFDDWLSHYIRGVSSRTEKPLDLSSCDAYGSGVHYCRMVVRFKELSFNYYAMKRQYFNMKCPRLNDTLVSTDDIFHGVCSLYNYHEGQNKPLE